MKDTIYFRHDYNAHSDPKMVKLRVKYGREGYGLFWGTMELMREESDIVLKKCDIDAFAFQLHYDSIAYEEFLQECVDIGLLLFDEKDNVFYSERLQRDVEYMREKSAKAKKSAEARWKKRDKKDANALQTQSDGNAKKKSKVKEKKEGYSESFEKFWKEYPRRDKGKAKAYEKYCKIIEKVDKQILLEKAKEYAKESEIVNRETKYIKHCATWLNQNGREDEYQTTENKAEKQSSGLKDRRQIKAEREASLSKNK